jgi:hypothetical protein
MANPFTMRSWSPYVVGFGIGVLSWFAFATADKHLAITLQYEHLAAFLQTALDSRTGQTNRYFAARATQGLSPVIGWYLMLLVGVFLGSFISSSLSGDRSRIKIPDLWRRRFGDSTALRFTFAFLGGALMVFGARIAGGCTSGHGISGMLQLAAQSWLFMPLAFVSAILTAHLLFAKEGGSHV